MSDRDRITRLLGTSREDAGCEGTLALLAEYVEGELAGREVDELPRFLDPALPDERLGQVPVDLDHDPTAGLQRHR